MELSRSEQVKLMIGLVLVVGGLASVGNTISRSQRSSADIQLSESSSNYQSPAQPEKIAQLVVPSEPSLPTLASADEMVVAQAPATPTATATQTPVETQNPFFRNYLIAIIAIVFVGLVGFYLMGHYLIEADYRRRRLP